MPEILVLIPVYNHAKKLGAVIDGCLNHFPKEKILIVDDGSTDASGDEGRKRDVQITKHEKNRGKGMALKTGFKWALEHGMDWVITLDADGQHSPDNLPAFISVARENRYDLTIGKRDFQVSKMPLTRIFSNASTSKILSKMTGLRIEDAQCGYRLIKSDLLENIELSSTDYLVETEMILKTAGLDKKIGFIPIKTIYEDEKSHMKSLKSMVRFLSTIRKVKQSISTNQGKSGSGKASNATQPPLEN